MATVSLWCAASAVAAAEARGLSNPRDRRAAVYLPQDSRASRGPHPPQLGVGAAEAAGLTARMSSRYQNR